MMMSIEEVNPLMRLESDDEDDDSTIVSGSSAVATCSDFQNHNQQQSSSMNWEATPTSRMYLLVHVFASACLSCMVINLTVKCMSLFI